MPITPVALDADDTLWHNETLFTVTQDSYRELLQPYLRRSWTGQGAVRLVRAGRA